jgi:hypothetical protein
MLELSQANKKIKTRIYEIQINLVYIKMFIFFSLKLASIQTLFHSYWPLLDVFGQMMHFCNSTWVKFIKKHI